MVTISKFWDVEPQKSTVTDKCVPPNTNTYPNNVIMIFFVVGNFSTTREALQTDNTKNITLNYS